MKLKNAIFDMDGTLFDSMFIWENVSARFLADRGFGMTEGFKERFFPLTIRDGAELIAQEYDIGKSADEIVIDINDTAEKMYEEEATLKPGVSELLEGMKKRGVKIALATTTDKYIAEKQLKRFGLFDYFSAIRTCTEAGRGKKFPDVFLQAAQMIGATPEESAVFEDSFFAIRTASAAGFFTVGLGDRSNLPKRDAVIESADVFYENIADFPLEKYF